MEKHMKIFLALALFFATATVSAATDWYETGPLGKRTISVTFTQPVESVAIHYVGKKGGKCTPPKATVGVMKFLPGSTVKTDTKLVANLGLKKTASGEFSASKSTSATTALPAVFQYSFINLLLSEFHYNIAYTRAGKIYYLGWRPDTGGGCTYTLN